MAHPIYVTYTPQTIGPHRICYHQTSPHADIAYCCLIDNTVSVVGVPKVFVIPDAGVSCDAGGPISQIVPGSPPNSPPINFVYNGYVQPLCAAGSAYETPWSNSVTFVEA